MCVHAESTTPIQIYPPPLPLPVNLSTTEGVLGGEEGVAEGVVGVPYLMFNIAISATSCPVGLLALECSGRGECLPG
jgi:hypothetical protein